MLAYRPIGGFTAKRKKFALEQRRSDWLYFVGFQRKTRRPVSRSAIFVDATVMRSMTHFGTCVGLVWQLTAWPVEGKLPASQSSSPPDV